MTNASAFRNLIETQELTPQGQQGMAEARAEVNAATLLNRALAVSGKTIEDLAIAMEEEVDSLRLAFDGDGELSVGRLAAVLRGIGYLLEIDGKPADSSVPSIPARQRRNRGTLAPQQARTVLVANVAREHYIQPIGNKYSYYPLLLDAGRAPAKVIPSVDSDSELDLPLEAIKGTFVPFAQVGRR